MFITTKRHEWQVESLKRDVNEIRDKYWELRYAHDRLLAELGLNEVVVPAHAKLVKKGEPEEG